MMTMALYRKSGRVVARLIPLIPIHLLNLYMMSLSFVYKALLLKLAPVTALHIMYKTSPDMKDTLSKKLT